MRSLVSLHSLREDIRGALGWRVLRSLDCARDDGRGASFVLMRSLVSLHSLRDDIMGFGWFGKNEVRNCAGRTKGVIRLADRLDRA